MSIPTSTRALGKWRGILLTVGLPETALNRRHGPCPMCEGKDRFRFDDKEARGTWICSQCGAGDGVQLVEKFKGISTGDALKLVDEILGTTRIAVVKPRPAMTPEEQLEATRKVWRASKPTVSGDVVDRYLAARGVAQGVYPASIRTATAMRYSDGSEHPAMVAMIADADGKIVSAHRTFLARTGKLDVQDCRKFMPGDLPQGACVRLSEWNGGALGIAEGIETAMAASRMFEMPVWACLNTALMQKWLPPEGCDELVIFADHDPHFAGHRAAYILANNIKSKPQWKDLDVKVLAPALPGTDWNDELRGAA